MCLNVDGEVFCSVLEAAPFFEGESLDQIEHQLEENKRPYTSEIEALIAQICGLSLDEYRRRLVEIRSRNLLRQLRRSDQRFFEKFGTYFVLASYLPFVEGRSHECPQIEHINAEAREALSLWLHESRFNRFSRRIETGIMIVDLIAYPEWEAWLPLVEEALRTRTRLKTFKMFALKQSDAPSHAVYYPNRQIAVVLAHYFRWFTDAAWIQPPAVIGQQLSAKEVGRLHRFLIEFNELERLRPRGKGGSRRGGAGRDQWREKLHATRSRFVGWKQSIQGMNEYLIEQHYIQMQESALGRTRKAA